VQPVLGDDRDALVGRDRLKHGHSESDVMLVLGIALAQLEDVVEEDDLAVGVLDSDDERLCGAVEFFVLPEVGNDGQVDEEKRVRLLNSLESLAHNYLKMSRRSQRKKISLTNSPFSRRGQPVSSLIVNIAYSRPLIIVL
jgi:hypothetical protein